MGETIRLHAMIACITMLSLLTLGGCNSAPAGDVPADWPIAELTIPASAMIDLGDKGSRTTDSGEKIWMVGINDTITWDQLNNHVIRCLKPLGYSESYAIKNGTDKRDRWRTYVSTDKLTEVVIMNLKVMGAPADKPTCTLTIHIQKAPSQDVLNAGKTVDGFEHVLKPL